MARKQRLIPVLTLLAMCSVAHGGQIFVDNIAGDDRSDGTSNKKTSLEVGPVRTLERAMRLARFGDTVIISKTSKPYYGSLSLTGHRHSGSPQVPFRILGNGATLSGARSVPSELWKRHRDNVWSFEPTKKGRYLLLLDGEAVKRFPAQFTSHYPHGIEEGQFAVCMGRVFYRSPKGEQPGERAFAIAQGTTGVSLFGVRNVIIKDLKVENFRIDGLNAHDLCRNVLVENVTAIANGRAGMTVKGSAELVVRNCRIEQNLEHSVLVQEAGEVDVKETAVDLEPTQR